MFQLLHPKEQADNDGGHSREGGKHKNTLHTKTFRFPEDKLEYDTFERLAKGICVGTGTADSSETGLHV